MRPMCFDNLKRKSDGIARKFPLGYIYWRSMCVHTLQGNSPETDVYSWAGAPYRAIVCLSPPSLSFSTHTHTLGSIVIINSILGYTNAHHSAGHPAAAARNACQLWFLLLFQRFFSRRHGVFLNRPITVNSISSSF